MQLSAGLQWIKNSLKLQSPRPFSLPLSHCDINEVFSLHDIFNLQDCQCTRAHESTLSENQPDDPFYLKAEKKKHQPDRLPLKIYNLYYFKKA